MLQSTKAYNKCKILGATSTFTVECYKITTDNISKPALRFYRLFRFSLSSALTFLSAAEENALRKGCFLFSRRNVWSTWEKVSWRRDAVSPSTSHMMENFIHNLSPTHGGTFFLVRLQVQPLNRLWWRLKWDFAVVETKDHDFLRTG